MSFEVTNSYNSYNSISYEKVNQPSRSEESREAKDKTADYYSYLQKNFDCVKNGKVSISGAYLRQCANDPEKAKQLEEDLAFYKKSYEDGYRNAQALAQADGGRLNSYDETWVYDSKGNLTMIASTSITVGDDTKEIQEKKLREKKLKEKKNQERLEEKRKEQKELDEKLLVKLQEIKPTINLRV